tara:strand:+ start:2192 stop:3442 length:1251 start_codon:yes stop_codon:yes gene_type:complete
MSSRFGFSGLNSNLNRGRDNNFNTLQALSNQIKAVRVKNIVLDETNSKWKTYGEWNGLGTIEFIDIKVPKSINSNTFDGVAQPLFPYLKNYPLINEIVYVVLLPSSDLGEKVTATQLYYITPISLWNSPHHNASPFIVDALPENQQRDYEQTEGGSVRRSTDQSTEITLGEYFQEKLNIHPLLPFEGDIIYEGRWGNSIRFGSTVKEKENTWSSSGGNGDPITIFRNGQDPNSSDEGWVPVKEDINKDLSSIYLTSTQTLPLTPSISNYDSYNSPPEKINNFSGKQIMLNSGRLVLNANTNHLLLSAEKSINLNTPGSVNIDSKNNTIIKVGKDSKILLGDKGATESVILGDKFLTDLQVFLQEMVKLSTALVASGIPIPFIPNAGAASTAPTMATAAQNIVNKIEKYKSKVSKTV